jgi:hypothetical protein
VTNAFSDHVTRFPAADPSKAEKFYTGASPSGLGIDSQGNVWVTNRFGNGLLGKLHLADMDVHAKFEGVVPAMDYMTTTMSKQQGGTPESGSVTLLRPDGTPYPGSPFTGGGLPGPWAVVVDGNDNVWISNFAMPSSPIVQLCGVRTETCPPGMKTGDQISPPGGYVGGGLQMQTDIAGAGNAGHHRHAQRRCVGPRGLEEPAGPLSEGRSDQRPDRLRGLRRASRSWDRSTTAGSG